MMSYFIHIIFMVYFLSRASLYEVERKGYDKVFFPGPIGTEPVGDPLRSK